MYKTYQEKASEQYRAIEAMYRKGYSTSEIARSTKLPLVNILDVTQKIFAMDMMRMGRA